MRITPRRVQRAVAFIEDHLDEPVTLDQIAAAAGVSRFALHRMFRASVGESLKRYVLKRRLTVAAEALAQTERGILRIALEAGFRSQEAFTRAFRAQFDVTPGRYRRDPASRRRPGLPRPRPETLDHRHAGVSHEPRIVTRERPLTVLGWGVAADFEDDTPIAAVWDRVLEAVQPGDGVELIGVAQASHPAIALDEAAGECLAYVAGVEACHWPSAATEPLTIVVPPGLYAVFEHRGPLERVVDTVNYAWASWLPRGEYAKSERPDLELVGSDQLHRADARMQLWMAIETI